MVQKSQGRDLQELLKLPRQKLIEQLKQARMLDQLINETQ